MNTYQNITIKYNDYDLVIEMPKDTNDESKKAYGVTDYDTGKPKVKGENYDATGYNGKYYVKKLVDQKVVTINMIACKMSDYKFLKDTVFIRGNNKFTCSIDDYTDILAEVTDFRASFSCGSVIKIVVELTIAKPPIN